jgi:hypothetical protein
MVFQGFDSDEEDEDSGDENINETKCLEQEPQKEESKSQDNFPNSSTAIAFGSPYQHTDLEENEEGEDEEGLETPIY